MTVKRTTSSGAFQMLIGSRPSGYEPTWPVAPPTPRNTYDVGQVTTGGVAINARVTATSPPVGLTGTFVVADNDFSTGRTEFHIGNYKLINGMDYLVGVAVGNTATNIAAAINRLDGFSASALAATVTVVFSDPMGEVEFRVLHRGSHTNFTPLTPSNGYFGGGDPVIGPPVMT